MILSSQKEEEKIVNERNTLQGKYSIKIVILYNLIEDIDSKKNLNTELIFPQKLKIISIRDTNIISRSMLSKIMKNLI